MSRREAAVSEAMPDQALNSPAVRAVRLGRPTVVTDRRADGTIYLRSTETLPRYPEKLTERLEYWAVHAPDRILFAQREGGGGWRCLTYAETLNRVRRIGEALIRRELSPERPIVILSGNDIEHALLGLAANYVGIPYAPISPAYSLISTDLAKLRYIFDLITPGLVFAADGDTYARAIEGVAAPDIEIVVTRHPIPSRRATQFSDLAALAATTAVDVAHANVGPDTIAKFLFTSGSTGMPKAVVNTQRMWCSNQEPQRTRLFPGRAARRRGLGTVAPHRGRQSQFRDRALQRRHLFHRRGQTVTRRDRGDRAQPAGSRAELVFQRAQGVRSAVAVPADRCPAAAELLQPPQGALVRRSRNCSERFRRNEAARREHLR